MLFRVHHVDHADKEVLGLFVVFVRFGFGTEGLGHNPAATQGEAQQGEKKKMQKARHSPIVGKLRLLETKNRIGLESIRQRATIWA